MKKSSAGLLLAQFVTFAHFLTSVVLDVGEGKEWGDDLLGLPEQCDERGKRHPEGLVVNSSNELEAVVKGLLSGAVGSSRNGSCGGGGAPSGERGIFLTKNCQRPMYFQDFKMDSPQIFFINQVVFVDPNDLLKGAGGNQSCSQGVAGTDSGLLGLGPSTQSGPPQAPFPTFCPPAVAPPSTSRQTPSLQPLQSQGLSTTPAATTTVIRSAGFNVDSKKKKGSNSSQAEEPEIEFNTGLTAKKILYSQPNKEPTNMKEGFEKSETGNVSKIEPSNSSNPKESKEIKSAEEGGGDVGGPLKGHLSCKTESINLSNPKESKETKPTEESGGEVGGPVKGQMTCKNDKLAFTSELGDEGPPAGVGGGEEQRLGSELEETQNGAISSLALFSSTTFPARSLASDPDNLDDFLIPFKRQWQSIWRKKYKVKRKAKEPKLILKRRESSNPDNGGRVI